MTTLILWTLPFRSPPFLAIWLLTSSDRKTPAFHWPALISFPWACRQFPFPYLVHIKISSGILLPIFRNFISIRELTGGVHLLVPLSFEHLYSRGFLAALFPLRDVKLPPPCWPALRLIEGCFIGRPRAALLTCLTSTWSLSNIFNFLLGWVKFFFLPP